MAAAAVAGGSGILASCRKASGGKTQSQDSDEAELTANEDLMREHGVLRRILIVYREVAAKILGNPEALDALALANAAKLFQTFAVPSRAQPFDVQRSRFFMRKTAARNGAMIAGF